MSSRSLPAQGPNKLKTESKESQKVENSTLFVIPLALERQVSSLCTRLTLGSRSTRAWQRKPRKECLARVDASGREQARLWYGWQARGKRYNVQLSFSILWIFFGSVLNLCDPGAGRLLELIFNFVSNFGPEGPKNSSGGLKGRKPQGKPSNIWRSVCSFCDPWKPLKDSRRLLRDQKRLGMAKVQPWTGKSCFSNRALVKASHEAPKRLFWSFWGLKIGLD